MSYLDKYKVDVPEGQQGHWKVERFTVTEEDTKWSRLRAAISYSSGGRSVEAGTYTRLARNGYVIMSDTYDEIRDHLAPIREAKGQCLVHGLGLGVVARAMLLKPEVDKVTVVEISQDVIDLVAPHYTEQFGDRVEVVCADALTWVSPKGTRYSVVWNDIWDNICSDNLPDMHKLHRRYGRKADWQGSWARYLCERNR